MMFNLIHPSRKRPTKSAETFKKWSDAAEYPQGGVWILSVDYDDDISAYVDAYKSIAQTSVIPVINKNKSSVEAINNGAKHFMAEGEIFIVVSDDTEPCHHWDTKILDVVKDKTDWILKTQDGIQPWIITMPVLDRAYYNRFGYVYHPSFEHMFCDTWMSVMADVTGRRLTSNLLFPHLNDSIKDEVRKKTDSTWAQGEKTFINLCKSLSKEDLRKITDQSMINWLRNKGVR